MKLRNLYLVGLSLFGFAPPGWPTLAALEGERRYLYVAQPGIRNYVEYGGVGILTKTRKIVATLTDEVGRAVQSEKMVEVVFSGGKAVRTGDQFGIGRRN